MKIEWLLQLVVLALFYLNTIIDIHHDELSITSSYGVDFLFLLFHALLFFAVNYILIPKFFYTKKYVLFFFNLIGLIILFGVIEEGILEPILTPDRGLNDVNFYGIYFFWGEILVPLLSFITIKFMFDNFSKQQQLELIEKDNLTNELKFLKSQIQPHILFNSLNNLYNFALLKSDKTPELILKLSNVLRYILYETTSQKVTLAKELSFVVDYIDLQKMQFEGRGTISYSLIEKSPIEHFTIAPFLLIPFIENSFKYSFGTKIKAVNVSVKIEIKKDNLQLLVSNNFEKMIFENDNLTHKGIGLKNVKKRLELLYPNQHELSIQELDNTYHVQLNLKLA